MSLSRPLRNSVHRTGQPVEERLLRKLQRQAARRMSEGRDFLLVWEAQILIEQ